MAQTAPAEEAEEAEATNPPALQARAKPVVAAERRRPYRRPTASRADAAAYPNPTVGLRIVAAQPGLAAVAGAAVAERSALPRRTGAAAVAAEAERSALPHRVVAEGAEEEAAVAAEAASRRDQSCVLSH